MVAPLSFFINKFWFKLNKGFGGHNTPTTIDLISKAQIILSSSLNNSISLCYDKLSVKLQSGKLTKDQAIATIIELRKKVKKPEEIYKDGVDEIIEVISEKNINNFIQEQSFLKVQNMQKSKENEELKKKLRRKVKKLGEETENRKKAEKQILRTKLKSNQKLLLEKKKTQKTLGEKQNICIKKTQKEYNYFRVNLFYLFILYYLFTYFLLWKFFAIQMQMVSTLLYAIMPFLVSFCYTLVKEKTLNPFDIISNKKKSLLLCNNKKLLFVPEDKILIDKEILLLTKSVENLTQKIENI
ncbi:MAG: hypothetical protein K8S23_08250 [Candidatus Cloacimonetes bacterium]|nr:hypothetical protein [Candidatus Cloacimonadota bacterium]